MTPDEFFRGIAEASDPRRNRADLLVSDRPLDLNGAGWIGLSDAERARYRAEPADGRDETPAKAGGAGAVIMWAIVAIVLALGVLGWMQ